MLGAEWGATPHRKDRLLDGWIFDLVGVLEDADEASDQRVLPLIITSAPLLNAPLSWTGTGNVPTIAWCSVVRLRLLKQKCSNALICDGR